MSSAPILLSTSEGIATLTLNRPDTLNALDKEMSALYFDLLDQCEADPEVRIIVVTGAGKGFCAGADFSSLLDIQAGDDSVTRAGNRRFDHAATLRKPVIAAINGACAGMGLSHALMCDIRFAAAGAKFTAAFARRGLIAEWGLAWVLPRIVGQTRAMDLLLSSRVFLAEEALAMGMVNQVVPGDQLLDTVYAYAADMVANCSPASMAIMKRQVWDDYEIPFDEALAKSIGLMHESFKRPDFVEGVASYLEKRAPEFGPA